MLNCFSSILVVLLYTFTVLHYVDTDILFPLEYGRTFLSERFEGLEAVLARKETFVRSTFKIQAWHEHRKVSSRSHISMQY